MSLPTILDRILKSKIYRVILAAVFVVSILGLLALAIIRDWDTIISHVWHVRGGYILAAGALHSVSLWLVFLVWHWMVTCMGQAPDIKTNFQIYVLSTIARRVPIPIWFLGTRLFLYRQHSMRGSVVVATTALETGLMILGGIISYIIVLPSYAYSPGFPLWPLMVLVIGLFVAMLMRPQIFVFAINFFLMRIKRRPINVSICRRDLVGWSVLHLITWFVGGAAFYSLTKAITDISADLPDMIAVTCLSTLVGLASQVLPSGLGLKELALGSLLRVWLPLSVGLVVSIAYRVVLTLTEMFWTIFAFLSLREAESHTDLTG